MREHEVPTHVQTEDRVLLWFTFPQIVAITAVCALSYGAYRYAPVGPSEVRMALAVVLGLAGIVMIVGQIGGRRLPLVAADLLKFGLGSRRYAGPPAQLVRSEPPAQAQPVRSGPGPLRMMARRAGKTLREPTQAAQAPGQGQRAEALPSPRLARQAPPAQRHERRQDQRSEGRQPGREGEAPEDLARHS